MSDTDVTRAVNLTTQQSLSGSVQPGVYSPKIDGYQVVREISRGGQGAVFEAIRLSTGRTVAIKILAGGALTTPRELARFDQEAKILAALDHPGIVQIIDRGQTADGSQYLVMDYVVGHPLSERLREGAMRSADPSEPLSLFLKIADAVNAAHVRGIVHRDLKPANIIIDPNGNPHILDFGLARTALMRYTDEPNPEPVTMTGQFLGSLPWSSPEQADGRSDRVDMRSDVYSLGVILYQLLTGAFPYTVEGSMRDVLNNILSVEPPPPSKVLEARVAREAHRRMRLRVGENKLNPTVDAIVLRALAKRPEDRYQTAGELARDVASYLSGRPTIAAGEVQRSWPKALWIAAGAGVATCVVGAVFLGMHLAGGATEAETVASEPVAAVGGQRPTQTAMPAPGDPMARGPEGGMQRPGGMQPPPAPGPAWRPGMPRPRPGGEQGRPMGEPPEDGGMREFPPEDPMGIGPGVPRGGMRGGEGMRPPDGQRPFMPGGAPGAAPPRPAPQQP